jgi:hypothetical protein
MVSRFDEAVVRRLGNSYRDRRTASTPAMAAAAAKNIAKRSASYAHANPRLNKETNAIVVSSRTLASNPCSPLCRGLRLALS